MNDQKQIISCLKDYILAEKELRENPISLSSSGEGLSNSPKSIEYRHLCWTYAQTSMALWIHTDIEYQEDGFREFVWNWRYWKVMARKCCWSQRFGDTEWAKATMQTLQNAELELVKVCGLIDIYKTSCEYLEEAFPGLKMKSNTSKQKI